MGDLRTSTGLNCQQNGPKERHFEVAFQSSTYHKVHDAKIWKVNGMVALAKQRCTGLLVLFYKRLLNEQDSSNEAKKAHFAHGMT